MGTGIIAYVNVRLGAVDGGSNDGGRGTRAKRVGQGGVSRFA